MKKTIQFTNLRRQMILLSILLIAGLIAGTVIQGGFNLGIDFQAGLNLQVEIDPASADADIVSVREALAALDSVQVQVLGADELQRFTVRVSDDGAVENFSVVKSAEVLQALQAAFPGDAVEILGEDYVEPRFASDLALNSSLLVLLAMGFILLYLWIRFRIAYALSSLAALVHDIIFMIFFIGTFQVEVNSATIAAVLTIIGYSLNDTIVIFDRIRENEKLLSDSSFSQVINVSVTQSLSRTIITSLTTLLAVLAIYIFTTGQIQDFALNMIVGVVVGTYSSIFIASPTLLALSKNKRMKVRTGDEKVAVASQPGQTGETAASQVDSQAVRAQLMAERNRKKKR